MEELLFEDYGNLNRIESSLINHDYDRDENGKIHIKNSSITGNSKIVVDKIVPHTFTHVFEMLDEDDSIGAIVIRAYGRQLCLVTKETKLYGLNAWSNHYAVRMSDYATYHLDMNYNYGRGLKGFEREAQAKTAVSRCVKAFFEKAPEGTRKKWDALIIYKDPEVEQLRNNRQNAKAGALPTPSDKNYGQFIDGLKEKYRERCIQYVDKVRKNTTNKQEIAEYIMNRANIQKFKFLDSTYERYNEDTRGVGSRFWVLYRKIDEGKGPDFIKLIFNWNGYIPYIYDIKWDMTRYGNFYHSIDEFNPELFNRQ